MKLLILASLLLVAVLLMSCSEDNPTDSSLLKDIWGHVELYDGEGVVLSDHSGVSVTLDGSSYSALSDASGVWRLENVPAGVHTIVFRKEGCSWTREEVQYAGNGEYYFGRRVLVTIPTYTILDFSAADEGNARLNFEATISEASPAGLTRAAYVFFTADSTSFEKTDTRRIATMVGGRVEAGMRSYVYYRDFYDRGVPPGSVVYLKAFPANPRHAASLDEEAKDYVVTNCSDNGSSIIRLVVP